VGYQSFGAIAMENRRVWSEEDIKALVSVLKQAMQDDHPCTFDEETRVAIKKLSKADPNVLVKIAEAAENATSYI